jgi:WD40-like Beta Propeller Repeat
VALAAMLALVGVLAVVDQSTRSDGEASADAADSTTTTERTTPTSIRLNAPATAPARTFVPTIPLSPGERLLGWQATGRGEVLDPATGTILSSDLVDGVGSVAVVPRLGGLVVVNLQAASATWFPELPFAGEPTTLANDVSDVFPSDIESRVWVVNGRGTASFAEVDLTTGEAFGPTELPVGAFPMGPIDGGLVVQAPDGLYAHRRGSDRFERIVNGPYVASAGRFVAYQACDEQLLCPVFVRDLANGSDIAIEASAEAGYVMDGALSPDGRWLAVVRQDPSRAWRITVFEVGTGRSLPVTSGPARSSGFIQPTWTPDGEWLVWPEFPGVRGFHPADNTAAIVDSNGAAYQGVAVLGPRSGPS